jgi:hypothetical protein
MKLTDEMCNEIFADLNIDLKRWVIATVQQLESNQKLVGRLPEPMRLRTNIIDKASGELCVSAQIYDMEGKQYYNMHKKAVKTAAWCFRFLLDAPELPFDKQNEE